MPDDGKAGERGQGRSDEESGDSGWRAVYQLAGQLGIVPDELTLRELLWMTDGHGRFNWSMNAVTNALVYNCHRGRNSRVAEPNDYLPECFKAPTKTLKSKEEILRFMEGK